MKITYESKLIDTMINGVRLDINDPENMAFLRLKEGIKFYENGVSTRLMLLGSQKEMNEMRNYCLKGGIPNSAIYLVDDQFIRNYMIEDNTSESFLKLSVLLNGEDMNEASLKYANEAVKLDPSNDSVWFWRSVPLMEMGKIKEAKESLERCLRINPNREEAMELMNLYKDEFSNVNTSYSQRRLKRRKKKMEENEEVKQMNPLMKEILRGLWMAFDYDSLTSHVKKEERTGK